MLAPTFGGWQGSLVGPPGFTCKVVGSAAGLGEVAHRPFRD